MTDWARWSTPTAEARAIGARRQLGPPRTAAEIAVCARWKAHWRRHRVSRSLPPRRGPRRPRGGYLRGQMPVRGSPPAGSRIARMTSRIREWKSSDLGVRGELRGWQLWVYAVEKLGIGHDPDAVFSLSRSESRWFSGGSGVPSPDLGPQATCITDPSSFGVNHFAIRRRFCAVAAIKNSSCAPLNPCSRKRFNFRIRLRCANSISTFLRSRRDC